MIVQCEGCQTKFKVDDEKVPEKGIKARCSQCKNVFRIEPSSTSLAGHHEVPKIEREDEKTISPYRVKQTRQKKPLSKILTVLLILLLLGCSIYFFRDKLSNISWIKTSISRTKNYISHFIPSRGDIIFSADKTQGYYLTNTKTGSIFIILGEAINSSSKPKSFLKVKGILFDNMDNRIMEKEVYCGNLLSNDELKTLEPSQINSHLNNPRGESSINTAIPPKKAIPFMIVFFNLQSEVKEFSVESTGSES
ncbi:MAG: DUF3426 domain-containing protein [Thermodesulfobacteriota bacterium]|nr:DUF3426 domain-containing protein [Thermodesulfobacteriota bacterium]